MTGPTLAPINQANYQTNKGVLEVNFINRGKLIYSIPITITISEQGGIYKGAYIIGTSAPAPPPCSRGPS